jgi:uncharacterized protein involved in response to NO
LWLLCLLWIGGRLSVVAPLAHAAFDIGYWLLLWSLLANEILRAGNRRNYKILLVLGPCSRAAMLAWHLAELGNSSWQQVAVGAELWLVLLLIKRGGVGASFPRLPPTGCGVRLRRRRSSNCRTPCLRPLALWTWPVWWHW